MGPWVARGSLGVQPHVARWVMGPRVRSGHMSQVSPIKFWVWGSGLEWHVANFKLMVSGLRVMRRDGLGHGLVEGTLGFNLMGLVGS